MLRRARFSSSRRRTLRMIGELRDIADNVRDRFFEDIEMFYKEGYSEHDCYEINSEVAEKIKSKLGLNAKVVPILFLADYGVEHYAVEVKAGTKILVVDAVPELTGLIPSWCSIESSFVGTYREYEKFFSKIVSRNND